MYLPDNMDNNLRNICKKIINLVQPEKIFVFGLKTEFLNGKVSDADICIIGSFDDNNEVMHLIYDKVEILIPFDLFIYSNEQWDLKTSDSGSFASRIKRKGRLVYER